MHKDGELHLVKSDLQLRVEDNTTGLTRTQHVNKSINIQKILLVDNNSSISGTTQLIESLALIHPAESSKNTSKCDSYQKIRFKVLTLKSMRNFLFQLSF